MSRIHSIAFVAILAILPMLGQDSMLGPSFRWQQVAGKVLEPVQQWELLGEYYQLTADPTSDKDGTVYFTNAKKNQILRIDLAGKISIWKEGSNGSHGAAFGSDARGDGI